MTEAGASAKSTWTPAGSALGSRWSPGAGLLVAGVVASVTVVANVAVDAADAWMRSGAPAMSAAIDAMGIGVLALVVFPLATLGWMTRWLVLAIASVAAARLASVHSASAIGHCFVGSGHALGILGWNGPGAPVVAVALAGVVAGTAVWSTWLGHRSHRRIDIADPVGAGCFCVLQGGGRFLNHHRRVAAQRFAVDLVGVRPIGLRTRRLVPRSLHDFVAFGVPVASPVAGRVVSVTDGIDDLGPRLPLAGNHVLLEPDGHPGWRVLVAHLRCGSVAVARGDRVGVGQRLGEVGSSGNSTEPHIHVHAQDEHGQGVPMQPTDRRRPLRRNDLVGPKARILATAGSPEGPHGQGRGAP